MGKQNRVLMVLAELWRAWRCRMRWNQDLQVEHLRTMLLADHRWLASDKTASALTERYLAALSPKWYTLQHEDTSQLRSRLGLVPPGGFDPGPGVTAGNPVLSSVSFEEAWPSISSELPQHMARAYTADDVEGAEYWAANEGWLAGLRAGHEICAAWCDNRAAYYNSRDDDGPDSRRGQGARACAAVLRWPTNFGRMPPGAVEGNIP